MQNQQFTVFIIFKHPPQFLIQLSLLILLVQILIHALFLPIIEPRISLPKVLRRVGYFLRCKRTSDTLEEDIEICPVRIVEGKLSMFPRDDMLLPPPLISTYSNQ